MALPILPIHIDLEKVQQLCQHYHILRLSLFGSVLREDFSHQSDVDILVEFEEEKTPGLEIITIKDQLSTIINRKVDLRTPDELSRYFREEVMKNAFLVYDKNR